MQRNNPLALTPRMVGTDHTDHKLLSFPVVLSAAPQVLYTAPDRLTVRFINATFCKVVAGAAKIYLTHYEASTATTFFFMYDEILSDPTVTDPWANRRLFEGGDVALLALEPMDQVAVYSDVANAIHCTVTVEENHARLTG